MNCNYMHSHAIFFCDDVICFTDFGSDQQNIDNFYTSSSRSLFSNNVSF